jgi:hypothetical protein
MISHSNPPPKCVHARHFSSLHEHSLNGDGRDFVSEFMVLEFEVSTLGVKVTSAMDISYYFSCKTSVLL